MVSLKLPTQVGHRVLGKENAEPQPAKRTALSSHPVSAFLEFLICEFDEVGPVGRGRVSILVLAEGNVA